MSSSKKLGSASRPNHETNGDDMESVFDALPLTPGDDAAAYDKLAAALKRAVTPKDIFEEIWKDEIKESCLTFRPSPAKRPPPRKNR
jgi:hypothetical protein